MFGNVTALVGLHVTGKYMTKHDAHMLQACGLESSQGRTPEMVRGWRAEGGRQRTARERASKARRRFQPRRASAFAAVVAVRAEWDPGGSETSAAAMCATSARSLMRRRARELRMPADERASHATLDWHADQLRPSIIVHY